jgi:hypothetical protein
MVRRGIRAIGRAPSAEANRLFDEFFGDWQPESFRKAVQNLPSAEENQWLVIARKYGKEFLSRSMSKRAKKTRPDVLSKNAKRDQWIREQYRQRKSLGRSYSVARFCRDLHLGQIKIPTDQMAQRQPEDLSDERIRKIIKDR